MPAAIRVLQRVLINYFYKINAGFFLFIFFVLFGLPVSPAAFHMSLITGIIQSQVFIAVVLLIWFLYDLKCLNYMLKQFYDPKQSFLFCFSNLPGRKIYLYMLYVHVMIYIPVIIYSGFIVWFAVIKQQYLCAVETITFNIITICATAFVYFVAVQKRNLLSRNLIVRQSQTDLPKPFFLIPLYFLWHDRKQMLLVTKVFSLLLLYAFINLYEPEGYDLRPLQLCLLLVAATHSSIIFQVRAFEEDYFSFSRNLPLKTADRFARLIVMYSCLLLPEFILLIKGYGIHFLLADYPQLLLLAVALLSLFHAVLLMEDMEMEQLMRIVFGILAACFFIILYSPGFILSIAVLGLAFIFFNAYFYNFEKRHK